MKLKCSKTNIKKQIKGQHLDEALAVASKNGYSVTVCYGWITKKPLGRDNVVVNVDKDLIVSGVI